MLKFILQFCAFFLILFLELGVDGVKMLFHLSDPLPCIIFLLNVLEILELSIVRVININNSVFFVSDNNNNNIF